jgi:hypothetical protein
LALLIHAGLDIMLSLKVLERATGDAWYKEGIG